MKLKHFLTLASLVIGGGSLWAQTDVTSTYLLNPSFELSAAETALATNVTASDAGALSIYGWTETLGNTDYNNREIINNSTKGSNSNHSAAFNAAAGNYHFFMRRSWNNNNALNFTYTSNSSTYAAGYYTVTYSYILEEGTSKGNTTTGSYMTLQALDGSTVIASEKVNAKNWGTTTPYTNTWATSTMTFTLTEEKELKLAVVITPRGGNKTEVHLDNFVITYASFATSSDYNALNTAISAVEGTTWGFDAGEYAPYNYVEVIQALAAAQAIDQDANNSQASVQALTATLTTAMTANAAEVNAIWDPSFEHEYSTSGNVQPIAWTGTTNHNNATDVRWMWDVSSNAGLNATSSKKALFTKFGVHYGQQEGYTLPLNADTYYTISFVYGGWSDCKKDGYVTMADPSSTNLTLIPSSDLPLDAVDGHSNSASWKNYQAFFKTNTAGNYVLGLRKKNENQQSQYVYGDFVLKTTTVAEATAYYNSVKTSVEDDYEESVYGGDEKTAFKNALDASMEGKTVAEIFAAASDLQTKHDTYVASKISYIKYYNERTRAIAMGVDENNIDDLTIASNMQTLINDIVVMEDAATANYEIDATDIFGAWTPQNTSSTNGQHWSGDGSISYIDKNDSQGFTMSVTNTVTLPAGSYVFKAAARAASNGVWDDALTMQVTDQPNAIFNPRGNTGYGIETNGNANYADEGTYANNDQGRGWEWRFIPFTLTESKEVTMKIEAIVKSGNWASFSDITLLTTSDNIAIAKSLWEKAKTAAETARDNATYAKVDGAEKKALTDAIGAEEIETTKWYQDQTETLKTATTNFTATATVTAYNRWDAAKTEATAISYSHEYVVGNTTTATEALTYANNLYTDMLNAQKDAKGQGSKVLGFQNGEYAPYNNIEVITAQSAAAAITDVAATETATLDAAISGLNAASDWAVNATDVDAIYNGSFAEANGTNPKGWTRSNNGWGQQITGLSAEANGVNEGTTTAWYYNNNGAWQYGNDGFYTMPLVANQLYKLTFKYRKHNSDWQNWMKASVLNGDNEGLAVVEYPGADNGTTFQSGVAYFTTGAAGNYTLSIEQNGNAHLTDVSLVKAEASETVLGAMPANYTYYQELTLNRTFSADKWNTLCAPFAFDKSNFAAVKVLSSVAEVAGDVNMTFADADETVAAGTPCLVKATNNGDGLTVANVALDPSTTAQTKTVGDALKVNYIGTFTQVDLTDANSNAWVVSNNNLYNVDSDVTVGAYRAYFTVETSGAVKALNFSFDAVDAIEAIDNGQLTLDNAEIYNLAGQRVNKAQRGIYIVNGKKVLVK